jgi:hypothetical protein
MIGIKQFPAIGIYFPETDNFSELPYNCIWILKGKDVSRNRNKIVLGKSCCVASQNKFVIFALKQTGSSLGSNDWAKGNKSVD